MTTILNASLIRLMTALILVALAAYQVFDEAQDMYKIVMKK